jgi:hypothetical protein
LERFTGQYQSIAPRQAILAAIIGLTQWQGASAAGDAFSFNGIKRVHLGNNVFRKPDAAAPNMVLVETADGVRMYTTTGANRLVPQWELWTKVAAMGVFALSLGLALMHAVVWIPSAFMGRLAERGGVSIRFLPFLAVAAAAGLPLSVLMLLSSGDFMTLGTPSAPAQGVYALSIAAPALAGLALLRAFMSSEDANILVRGLAWACALSAAMACAYFWVYGWIALKLWM